MDTTKSIWSNATRDRHFLIPDSEELPSGEFNLLTVTGRQQQVDPEALAPYAISQEEAKAWLKDQFGQVVESAKQAVMDSIRSKMASEPDLDAWFGKPSAEPSPSTLKEPTDSPALSLLAALSDESLERLQSDPQMVSRAVRSLFTQLGTIFSDATASDDARIETARVRIMTLGSILQQHGLNIGESLDSLPDNLREAYRSAGHDMDSEQTAERLDALADSLQQAATTSADWLRGLAQELRQRQDL